MRRRLRIGIAALVLALTTIGTAQTPPATTLQVSGLQERVDILRDHWGINHIYAKNEHDLFFAQGYAAARDRLFQFELWRRQATGTVAEILGRKELRRDIGTRLHMFRGDLDAELNWYHPHGKAIVTAYVDGVNAYIAEVVKDPAALPIEFRMLGITPQPWTPAVVVSRHNALLANIGEEVRTAQAVRVLGPDGVKALSYFQGGDPLLKPDPTLDLSLINDQVLDLYNAFREPLRFTPDEITPEFRASGTQRLDALAALRHDDTPDPVDIGSNNWVVSGARTSTGAPMMMNDPHRTQSAPSLRYWVHLVAPGWNVIGAGEPVLPGVSIGHNEHGAWGLTIFGGDSEDLYVYDTNPANPSQYKYRGAWEDMRIVKDTIAVKGESPIAVDLKFTRHGPVLSEDTAHHKAYALHAAWMDTGAAPYLASLRMDQAKTWDEFRDACSYSRLPSENMVWADVEGNIGYQAVGVTPLRPNWSGMIPVPGDGRYEWAGYLPIKDLPHELNPARGYIATANNYVVPRGWNHPDAMHYTWADAFRADRISAVLGSGALFTVADMERLQSDVTSIPARSLVPLLRDIPIQDQATAKARDALVPWDGVLDASSEPAGIYEMWVRRLRANLKDLLVPAAARPFFPTLSFTQSINWLHAPDGRLGVDPIASRDDLLVRSLTEAIGDLSRKLGPDVTKWQWGQNAYHHALIRHPLSAVVNAATRERLDVGPYPRGGDSYTINATGSGDNQTSGGSMKIIADTGTWDNSVGLNNPGQSGDPSSAHYRDLFQLWSRDRYFPIFYSRTKVESVVEEGLALVPPGPTAVGTSGNAAAAGATYQDLTALFAEWRIFQQPKRVNGVPDYSAVAMAAQQQALPSLMQRLAAVDPRSWTISEQVDYYLVRAEMNGLDFDHRVLRPWANNPAFYVTAFMEESDQPLREGPLAAGGVDLWKYKMPLSAADASEIDAGLRTIPALLDQARTNLTGNERDLWVYGIESIKGQSADLAKFAATLGSTQPALAATVQKAKAATDAFALWLESAASSKTGLSGIGIDNYDWYLKNVQLVPYTWRDEVTLMERELSRAWASLALEEQKNAKLPPQEPIDRADYARRADAAVTEYMGFLKDHSIITIRPYMDPGLRAHVGRYPAAPREFFSEVDVRDPEVMRTHGFHWFDKGWMREVDNPSPIRKMTPLYNIFDTRTEGFATAFEELMLEAGMFDARPRSRELVYILVAERAARALGDLKMHANQATLEQASQFASDHTPRGWLSMKANTVRSEQHLYLQQPAYGTSYVIGKVETDKMIAERRRQLGDTFTMRRFMDDFTAAGFVPLSLLRWELTGELPPDVAAMLGR